MPLSEEELARYARHLVLKDIGGPGQEKLKHARVLVVGAGGLGAPLLMYLAAAGVGTLGIVEDGRITLSNLQRQVMYKTAACGQPKGEQAKHFLQELNPHVEIKLHTERLVPENALSILEDYHLVADGTDTYATRFLVSDACYFAKKPLVWAAVGPFEGHLSTFRPFAQDPHDPEGHPYPSYRCLVDKPPHDALPCSEGGILGAVTGVMGSLQALEVIKALTGAGDSLVGRLLIYDALAPRVRILRLPWDQDNPLSGTHPRIPPPGHPEYPDYS